MSKISAHQLDRRLEKLEAMPDASEPHVIIVTFEDDQIGDQIECRGTVYQRLAGEDDSVFQRRIVSGISPSVSPVVMVSVAA